MPQVAPRDRLDAPPVRLVAIGGGTGLPNLLRGIREWHPRVEITAIVTTFDDGGSSGKLRQQLGVPGLGDVRRCLVALANRADGSNANAIAEVMSHRFPSDAGMDCHSLGNLVLAALAQRLGGLSAATRAMSQMLEITGTVVPVADEAGELRALLRDGTWIESESAIDMRGDDASPISRVELRRAVTANADAVEALVSADLITLGPGDLYTSVIANLLPDGIVDAIHQSRATVVYVGNIVNKPAEAANFRASDYLRAVNRYLQPNRVGVALFNRPDESDANASLAVRIDDAARDLVGEVRVADYRSASNPAIHDPRKLAAGLMQVAELRGD